MYLAIALSPTWYVFNIKHRDIFKARLSAGFRFFNTVVNTMRKDTFVCFSLHVQR